MRKGQADAIFKIIDLMEETRPARQVLYKIGIPSAIIKPINQWTKDECDAADKAVRAFDILGMLQKQGFVPDSFFKEFYAVSAYRCWQICMPFVAEARQTRMQPTLHLAFENAAKKALSERPDAPIPMQSSAASSR